MLGHFQPTNDLEYQLISQIAAAQWRIDRCMRMETAYLSGLQDLKRKAFDERNIDEPKNQFLEDMRTAETWRDMMVESCLKELNQTEARFQRQYTRALTTLLKLQKGRQFQQSQVGQASLPAALLAAAPSSHSPQDPTLELNALPATKNLENEPNNSKSNTQIDTNELPPHTQNPQNEPSNLLKTQRERILAFCNSEAFLNSFAPRLELVKQGKLSHDAYLAEIRDSVATLLKIAKTNPAVLQDPRNRTVRAEQAGSETVSEQVVK